MIEGAMSESVPPAGASRPGKPGAHYDLFISYTTNPDARLAKSLKVFIERFHLLKTPERASLRELNVCLDSENFVEPGGESRPGTKLSAILQKHLEDSALILILCSRSTRISTGMKQEFDLLEKAQRLKDVILAVTDGENPRIPEGMFPRWILDANLDKSIWYDFREYRHAKNPKVLSKKSFNAERVRLACQLNGSSLHDVLPLWYREQERTRRRKLIGTRIVACCFFALALIASAFGWKWFRTSQMEAQERKKADDYAIEAGRQKNEAVRERNKANRATEEANRRLSRLLENQGREALLAGDLAVAFDRLSEAMRLSEQPGGEVDRPALRFLLKRSISAVSQAPPRFAQASEGKETYTDLRLALGGKFLVGMSANGSTSVWDLASKRLLKSASLKGGICALSLDTLRFVNWDGPAARVYGLLDNQEIAAMSYPDGSISSASISPDGRFVATTNRDHAGGLIWEIGKTDPIHLKNDNRLIGWMFSPDGSRFITCPIGTDILQVWTVRSASLQAQLDAPMRYLSLSDDGQRILGTGRGIWFWDLTRERPEPNPNFKSPLETLRREFRSVSGGAILSASGGLILTFDGDAQIWDATRTTMVTRFKHNSSKDIVCAAFSPDETMVATGGGEGDIRLWDTMSGELMASLPQHSDERVTAVIFSPDGRSVISAGSEGRVLEWRDPLGSFPFFGSRANDVSKPRRDTAFVLGGRAVAVAPPGQPAKILDLAETRVLYSLGTDPVTTNILASPDGRLLLTQQIPGPRPAGAKPDTRLRVWDAENGKLMSTLPMRWFARKLFFIAGGKEILAETEDKTLEIWSIASGSLRVTIPQGPCEQDYPHYSPDLRRALALRPNNRIVLWDLERGEVSCERALPEYGEGRLRHTPYFSSAGPFVVLRTGRMFTLLDNSSGETVFSLKTGSYPDMVCSNDGRILMVWTDMAPVGEFYEAATGKLLGRFQRDGGRIASAGFNSDGTRIFIRFLDNALQIRDPSTGALVTELSDLPHTNPESTRFSPDGQILAVAGGKSTALLVASTSGKVLKTLASHEAQVFDFLFDPKGRFLISKDQDGTCRLWGLPGGELLSILRGYPEFGLTLGISPDGNILTTWSGYVTRVWDLSSYSGSYEGLLKIPKELAPR